MANIEKNIETRVENWKKSLLDMTRRNRLLWYKPYRVGSLKLEKETFDNHVSDVINEVDDLAFRDKTWHFTTEEDPSENIKYVEEDKSEPEESILIEERTKALANIYKKIKQESEEKGLNIGYIAVGFLEWYERNDALTKIKTPLILIPIKIEQEARRSPFVVSLNENEQITLNPIIKKKFESDFNIILNDLPTDLDGHLSLRFYLDQISAQITDEANWVVNEDVVIDTFSFQNLAIWNDLDKNKKIVLDSPFSKVLAGGSLEDEGFFYDKTDESNLDEVKSEDNLNIYETDSSQQEAIYRAKKGESFVIQGPPGTGKSQTITNIIAEMLYLGKRILFVSEKQAALDVVYSKLDKKNLSDFCLILHNSKARKQDVRDQIKKTLELSSKRSNITNEAIRVYKDFDDMRKKLNAYTEKLHEEYDDGTTPYMLMGELDKLRDVKDLVFDMPENFDWDMNYETEVINMFNRIEEYGKSLIDDTKHFSNNYWKFYKGKIDNTTKRSIQEKIGNINESILNDLISSISEKNINTSCIEIFKFFDSIPFSQANCDEIKKQLSQYQNERAKLKNTMAKLDDLKKVNSKNRANILENFSEAFLDLSNPNEYQKKLINKYSSIKNRIFNKDYKKISDELNELSLKKIKYDGYVEYLGKLIEYNTNIAAISEYENNIKNINTKCKAIINKISSQINSKKQDILDLTEKLDFDSLLEYQHYLEAKNIILKEYKLNDFVEKIENIETIYKSDEISKIFKKRFLTLSLELTEFDKKYSKYNNLEHETDVDNFRKYDEKTLDISAARIRCKLISKMPSFSLFGNSMHGQELQLLQRELKKKSRLMPTRTLIKSLPTILPSLKPCMMMSPLTVSSYFGMNPDWKFDVVIFDEASQVKPEYAITSIIRGKQVIVAGDSKQMPPTSFFDATDDESDEYRDEENPQLTNLESILDEMSSVFPDVYLNWHYRSKDESLILFSNNKFYNSRLATFSAPVINSDLGISFEYCKDGVWDSKNGNRPEAEKVANIVFEHIKNHPEQSLGVVTFGKSQEYAISTAIDKLRDLYPEYESFFNENKTDAFFVKNLERVQGDERDKIIISWGYGKDRNGNFAMRFGPLALAGGERRLNVAISRARQSMIVVSSFRANEVRNTENNPQTKIIRDFIDYAEHGISALLGDNVSSEEQAPVFDSGFEEDVYNVLKNNGYRLRTQVGSSGYRIDIAVIHPKIDGRFVLAIECDGAAYHSSRTARDRDILRQKILEAQGWKFYRIWSTDWYHDNTNTQKRLIGAVQKAIDDYGKKRIKKEDEEESKENKIVIETAAEDVDSILSKIYNSWSSKLRKTYGMGSYGYKGWKNNDGWDSLYIMEHYDDIQKIIKDILPYKNGLAPEDVFREINKMVYRKGRYSSQADILYKKKFKKDFIDTGKVEIINGCISIK